MNLKKTYKITPYNWYLNVIVTNDFSASVEKYNKGLQFIGIETCGGFFTSHTNQPHEGWIFIKPDSELSTISHESFHATVKLMSDIGAELESSSEESYAYLLGHIVNLVLDTADLYLKKADKLKASLNQDPDNKDGNVNIII